MFLALRGSGQALYVGCADDVYVVASEPYGLVEVAPTYLRLDGETMREVAATPRARGRSSCSTATRLATAPRRTGSRTTAPSCRSGRASGSQPEITTRDVDRGDAPHYLLKEITEAPESFRKTLRGKLVERRRRLDVRLSPAVLARRAARAGCATGSIRGSS